MIECSLTWTLFNEGLVAACRVCCMIRLIFAGAAFLTLSTGFMGLPRHLAEFIGSLNLSPLVLILRPTGFFIVQGCLLDGISMVVLTMAVLLPTVQKAGFDLIWFGIFIVLVVEMAQITPPVGFNLFVLQNLTGREITYPARTAMPLFVLILADGRIDSMITSAVTVSKVGSGITFATTTRSTRGVPRISCSSTSNDSTRCYLKRAPMSRVRQKWLKSVAGRRANWRHRNRRKPCAAMALRSTLRRWGWTANCNASVSDFQVNGSRQYAPTPSKFLSRISW